MGWKAGDRVVHKTWGRGNVLSVSGEVDAPIYNVTFDVWGLKCDVTSDAMSLTTPPPISTEGLVVDDRVSAVINGGVTYGTVIAYVPDSGYAVRWDDGAVAAPYGSGELTKVVPLDTVIGKFVSAVTEPSKPSKQSGCLFAVDDEVLEDYVDHVVIVEVVACSIETGGGAPTYLVRRVSTGGSGFVSERRLTALPTTGVKFPIGDHVYHETNQYGVVVGFNLPHRTYEVSFHRPRCRTWVPAEELVQSRYNDRSKVAAPYRRNGDAVVPVERYQMLVGGE